MGDAAKLLLKLDYFNYVFYFYINHRHADPETREIETKVKAIWSPSSNVIDSVKRLLNELRTLLAAKIPHILGLNVPLTQNPYNLLICTLRNDFEGGRIYVSSGWKHYARCRKTLRWNFVSWGKMVVFFDRREKKQFFQGKQMFFSEFFCARHNVFQPGGYIFLGFHPLTYHKPLHFDVFCFILPLQISLISWPIGLSPAGAAGDPKGAEPLWPQCDDF